MCSREVLRSARDVPEGFVDAVFGNLKTLGCPSHVARSGIGLVPLGSPPIVRKLFSAGTFLDPQGRFL